MPVCFGMSQFRRSRHIGTEKRAGMKQCGQPKKLSGLRWRRRWEEARDLPWLVDRVTR